MVIQISVLLLDHCLPSCSSVSMGCTAAGLYAAVIGMPLYAPYSMESLLAHRSLSCLLPSAPIHQSLPQAIGGTSPVFRSPPWQPYLPRLPTPPSMRLSGATHSLFLGLLSQHVITSVPERSPAPSVYIDTASALPFFLLTQLSAASRPTPARELEAATEFAGTEHTQSTPRVVSFSVSPLVTRQVRLSGRVARAFPSYTAAATCFCSLF